MSAAVLAWSAFVVLSVVWVISCVAGYRWESRLEGRRARLVEAEEWQRAKDARRVVSVSTSKLTPLLRVASTITGESIVATTITAESIVASTLTPEVVLRDALSSGMVLDGWALTGRSLGAPRLSTTRGGRVARAARSLGAGRRARRARSLARSARSRLSGGLAGSRGPRSSLAASAVPTEPASGSGPWSSPSVAQVPGGAGPAVDAAALDTPSGADPTVEVGLDEDQPGGAR